MFGWKPLSYFLLAAAAQAKYIVPGARWIDTDGNLVNAHAGGVTVGKDGKFYLFGEYKIEGQTEGGGVSVYSSDDLATWTSHGLALEPIEDHPYIAPDKIIQRPKVLYNANDDQYHMHWHADNSTYGWLLQGLAISPNITGPYTFLNATAPFGNWSQDFGTFTDYKTQKSYAMYSNGDRKEARDVYLAAYDSSNTELENIVHRFDKYDLEAPTIIQTNSSYYALMSHKTGYRPNNVVAFRADKLEGPWSQPFFVATPNTRTYNSQSGFSLRISGTKRTTWLYLGDQWDSNSLWESRYIWLPVDIDDEAKSLKLEWWDVYDLDVKTGEYTPINGTPYYAIDAITSGDAYKQEANFASNNTIITNISGNTSTATFHIPSNGSHHWLSFYYQNTDDMGFGDQPGGSPDRIKTPWALRRISSVVVNGNVTGMQTLYQRDTHKGVVLSTPLKVWLDEGVNSVEVGGLWNGIDVKGADLDRIVVYPTED
ncbi:carbohydrate-binding module family 35 protein [Aureobasidium subglaciale EXF-2481]|uniref:Carbohydrate-binding module family 35 protein n=1 Tax=Aureobasidium subglaciale (strain EXF-2481) TaxID=1043005 RepID=A0A074ZJB3_AURSE|nr:carbohydrate-binding module family 35 protein [Aureobasidium subglaciale EXF-2481]KAI5198828.1 glycoside hydrolase family 43 protein [Aureobasidium subglaciale]KAI5217637.1 glycoside hydrolase family 43 protein [Aureobasidium subglaciale]KAI5221236.1 glycoside hydrolase family 43 protein [Aureobasidium subglaciale]KAI5258906.1 glycoside hydrolase family 43 protein [Aureobasidium subglaciale]KEQ98591.1 carbohydrate-binding module family 35 protein [Aureobasidium subglaciale EXF-2481]